MSSVPHSNLSTSANSLASEPPLRELIALPVEFALLSLHATVTAFIGAQIRSKNKAYTTAFFKLFLLQCVSNYLCYAAVSLSLWIDVVLDDVIPSDNRFS